MFRFLKVRRKSSKELIDEGCGQCPTRKRSSGGLTECTEQGYLISIKDIATRDKKGSDKCW
jgi:hypothetical protein